MLFDENNVDQASSLYLDHLDHEGVPNVLMARYDQAVQREKQRAERETESILRSLTHTEWDRRQKKVETMGNEICLTTTAMS